MTCKKNIHHYFDEQSNRYSSRSQRGIWKYLRKFERKCLVQNLQQIEAKRILEIGCGSGYYTKVLRENFPHSEIFCVDLSERMLAQNSTSGCVKICADIERLYILGTFDLIFSAGALEFLEHPIRTVKRLGDNLSGQGKIVFLAPRRGIFGSFYKEYHRWHKIKVRLFRATDFNLRATSLSFDSAKSVFPFSLVVKLTRM